MSALSHLKAIITKQIESRHIQKTQAAIEAQHRLVFPKPMSSIDYDVLKEIYKDKAYAPYFPFYSTSTILDIGAHKGFFSLWASRNLSPESHIYSIEPSTMNFKSLTENVQANKITNVHALKHAVGEHSGTCELFLSKSINHSLVREHSEFFSETQAVESEVTSVLSLEDLFAKLKLTEIDFLKLDCEGAEYQILLNGRNACLKAVNIISMEFHDMKKPGFSSNELIGVLEAQGFQIVMLKYEGGILNTNFGKLIAKRR